MAGAAGVLPRPSAMRLTGWVCSPPDSASITCRRPRPIRSISTPSCDSTSISGSRSRLRIRYRCRGRVARRQQVKERVATTYARLRDNPERADVHRGDALNVILDELNAPGYLQPVYQCGSGATVDDPGEGPTFSVRPSSDHHQPRRTREPRSGRDQGSRHSTRNGSLSKRSPPERDRSRRSDDPIPIETLKSVRAAIKQLQDRDQVRGPRRP